MKKLLVIGIIFLFIGVTIAPSITHSVVKASQENDLVEVTTQTCGIQGYGDTTVRLTREQYQDLEQYLVEFRARLNQTTTREEAVPLFKEAVVQLDRYGLLPRGMSVENANRFLAMRNQEYDNFKKLNISSKFSQKSSGFTNAFCFVVLHVTTGWVTEWGLVELSFMFFIFILVILETITGMTFPLLYKLISLPFAKLLVALSNYYNSNSPLKFWVILYGYINECWSIGLKGFKYSNTGVDAIGFIGLRLILPNDEIYYVGHALWVDPA